MPHEMHWLIPNRVIVTRISGKVSGEEFAAMTVEVNTMVRAGTAPVHVIHELSQLTAWPDLGSMMSGFKTVPSEGMTCITGLKNPLLHLIANSLTHVASFHLAVFSTTDSAWQFLLDHDGSVQYSDIDHAVGKVYGLGETAL